ncbi:hypothetical protein CONCODRAFT_13383 [Conidiobolus coronatus NRRL 28638]|uniref:Uncharacterized protein n=1 Tax=Conidiobolus coronatus (strain ATCC 28846 / CBS 209.66 / NRRL 28638) TaxID=796925 RepID=A0A137NQY6_CONC2|nr:hypothetical protein CONCODRAFT_13383 [Conidiobolus coronatus NRRL 28638]|eukprot:KXN65134.1 hypothetical protein CONCODRAFT_13383 [Conidiobolus coronatus NRRL 28638]
MSTINNYLQHFKSIIANPPTSVKEMLIFNQIINKINTIATTTINMQEYQNGINNIKEIFNISEEFEIISFISENFKEDWNLANEINEMDPKEIFPFSSSPNLNQGEFEINQLNLAIQTQSNTSTGSQAIEESIISSLSYPTDLSTISTIYQPLEETSIFNQSYGDNNFAISQESNLIFNELEGIDVIETIPNLNLLVNNQDYSQSYNQTTLAQKRSINSENNSLISEKIQRLNQIAIESNHFNNSNGLLTINNWELNFISTNKVNISDLHTINLMDSTKLYCIQVNSQDYSFTTPINEDLTKLLNQYFYSPQEYVNRKFADTPFKSTIKIIIKQIVEAQIELVKKFRLLPIFADILLLAKALVFKNPKEPKNTYYILRIIYLVFLYSPLNIGSYTTYPNLNNKYYNDIYHERLDLDNIINYLYTKDKAFGNFDSINLISILNNNNNAIDNGFITKSLNHLITHFNGSQMMTIYSNPQDKSKLNLLKKSLKDLLLANKDLDIIKRIDISKDKQYNRFFNLCENYYNLYELGPGDNLFLIDEPILTTQFYQNSCLDYYSLAVIFKNNFNNYLMVKRSIKKPKDEDEFKLNIQNAISICIGAINATTNNLTNI